MRKQMVTTMYIINGLNWRLFWRRHFLKKLRGYVDGRVKYENLVLSNVLVRVELPP